MAKWQENVTRIPSYCYALYLDALTKRQTMDLRDKIPACIDFYEGRQWPEPTESTKNLPRPVVNIIKMICRSKKGAILSTPVKIQYKSYSSYTDTERFNAFAKSVFKDMHQDELDRRGIDDGIKKGSYFFHYYWDGDAIFSQGGESGALMCELIDPLNIFFSDPSEVDEQKQDWIMIVSSKAVNKIVALTDEPSAARHLEYLLNTDEAKESGGKIKLFTRYFRKNGEIWCERHTMYHTISKPFKVIPDHKEIILDEKENSNDWLKIRHSQSKNPQARELYPIVCGVYEGREGSIYGMGEVEGLIPNQKSINFNIAMSLLNAQQCAWGKYIALPNALNGQKISNVPGQILIDYSGTGQGIKRLPESELSKSPLEITTLLEELTRSVSGASDVMTGESFGTNLSGAAIAYLQAQAQVPLEELKSSFYSVKRKQGEVVAQFLKHFYFKRAFIKESQVKKGEVAEEFDEFSSIDFENSLFDVYVEAIGGTRATLASDISMLDTCLKNGSISLETYIRAYPESAITNKDAILKQIELEKSSEINKLKQELAEIKHKTGVETR